MPRAAVSPTQIPQRPPVDLSAWLLAAGLIVGVVSSGLAVAYQVHQSRLEFRKLEAAKKQRDQLEVDWGRLLIEQQTFGATTQIASRAVVSLRMYSPPPAQTIRLSGPNQARSPNRSTLP